MSRWRVEEVDTGDLGYFRIYVTPPGGARTEVTIVRNVPTTVLNYSSADPFGDSTAQLQFDAISVVDDLGAGDLDWFAQFADVDIELDYLDGSVDTVFEGFVVSWEFTHSETASSLLMTCQGALYQADRYVSFPEYPSTPIANEVLIAQVFSPHLRPALRNQPLAIEWPDDWDVLAYRTTDVVGAQTGGRATGFSTRSTGGWEKSLTGFVANLLQVMYTSDYADQWTIRKDPGRQPVMCVRFAARTPDATYDAGQPGVNIELSRDYTQYANVIYGSGTSLDGSAWTRQTVAADTSLTGYLPMAADPRVYPDSSAQIDHSIMRSETYVQFEQGMEETTALRTAALMLRANADPGFAGTMTLTVDPPEMSRFLLKAGMTVKLRHVAGRGDEGINLHISQVQANLHDGSVQLTVDSKYRDALTVDEALARTRDPLTPIKMLQVGKQSILIPDQMAPWSYTLGSGYLPKASQPLYTAANTAGQSFPFDTVVKKYPPKSNPSYYVGLNAASSTANGRWSGPIQIRMAEKGSIRLSQIALYDRDGNRVFAPFHVAFYYASGIAMTSMPMGLDGQHSPFVTGAFLNTNQYGLTIPAGTQGNITMPDPSLVIGWGTGDQPAGYSPGTKTNGDPLTGLLVDETEWAFDLTSNPDFQKNPTAGYTQLESAISIYMMAYAEYHDWVYLTGRLYNKPAGIN